MGVCNGCMSRDFEYPDRDEETIMKIQEQRLQFHHLTSNSLLNMFSKYPTFVNDRQLDEILTELKINNYQLTEPDSPIQYLYEQFKMEGGFSTKKLQTLGFLLCKSRNANMYMFELYDSDNMGELDGKQLNELLECTFYIAGLYLPEYACRCVPSEELSKYIGKLAKNIEAAAKIGVAKLLEGNLTVSRDKFRCLMIDYDFLNSTYAARDLILKSHSEPGTVVTRQ